MDRSLAWTAGILAPLGALGYAAGSLVAALGIPFGPGALVAVLFWTTFLASALALQMYRRGLPRSALVATLAGGLGAGAFFSALVGPANLSVMDPLAGMVFLGVVPLVVAGMSGASALFLARGVREYREKHGLKHAPR